MKRSGFFTGLAITLAVFALLLAGALQLMDSIGSASVEAQVETLKSAARNAMITCYAVEGFYPQSVDYLVEEYGLRYDESRFLISCDGFASNIMPEIRVSVKGATGIGK